MHAKLFTQKSDLKSQNPAHISTKSHSVQTPALRVRITYQVGRMMSYENMNSAGRNPTRRPLHPRPAGSFQAKSKSQSVLETSSSTMCSPLSNEQTVTADFILDPPPTCKRWAWGVFFFLESEASHVNSPENPYGSTSCDSSADACVLINQVTLVSSSRLPSECPSYSSSCYRLS